MTLTDLVAELPAPSTAVIVIDTDCDVPSGTAG